jgi:hypothetical protein
VCRTSHYHKRLHYQGKAQAQSYAATRIQAAFRGYLQRKRFLKLRLRSNSQFRSDYAFQQVKSLSDAYTVIAAHREQHINQFLAELDLTRQKALSSMFTEQDWERIRDQILSRYETAECAICMNSIAPAIEQSIHPDAVGSGGPPVVPKVSSEGTVLTMLSCGHCFHEPCLSSFEQYAEKSNLNSGGIARCPVCRAGYTRRPLLDY